MDSLYKTFLSVGPWHHCDTPHRAYVCIVINCNATDDDDSDVVVVDDDDDDDDFCSGSSDVQDVLTV